MSQLAEVVWNDAGDENRALRLEVFRLLPR